MNDTNFWKALNLSPWWLVELETLISSLLRTILQYILSISYPKLIKYNYSIKHVSLNSQDHLRYKYYKPLQIIFFLGWHFGEKNKSLMSSLKKFCQCNYYNRFCQFMQYKGYFELFKWNIEMYDLRFTVRFKMYWIRFQNPGIPFDTELKHL